MVDDKDFALSCPLPLTDYPEVTLAHGSGKLLNELIGKMFVPAFANPMLAARHDGAVFDLGGARLAMTTDSYVVRPPFFPGGDIGALAVHGTVNDLAMCGARPLYLSCGLILEEGFPMADLWRIVLSMRDAAESAGVRLVTGDTKVVDRGKGDKIFINTSGIGSVAHDLEIGPGAVAAGDAVLLSGDIGRHGVAVMAVREGLAFESAIESDTAPLAEPVMALIEAGISVHCLRDPTRGGLAGVLVEIAGDSRLGIEIEEAAIPVSEGVRGACEILGLDPLHVANEGRFVAFVPGAEAEKALALLRARPLCAQASIIGAVKDADAGVVSVKGPIGGSRIIDMLSGEQLPRIC